MVLQKRWAVIACIFAICGIAKTQAQGDGEKSGRQQQYSQPEQAKSVPSQPVVGGAAAQPQAANHGPAEAEVYQPDCGKPKNQPDADLCTQRRVADAAEKALQYTLAQTVIGGLGVFFVVITLGFTARANKATAIAAQAAVDAVNADRAWICYENTSFKLDNHLIDQNGEAHIEAYKIFSTFRNSGKNPALRVAVGSIGTFVSIGDGMPELKLLPTDEHRNSILGPGAISESQPKWLTGENLERLKSGKSKYVHYVKVFYSTVNAPDRELITEACMEIFSTGTIKDENGVLRPVFTSRLVGKNNIMT